MPVVPGPAQGDEVQGRAGAAADPDAGPAGAPSADSLVKVVALDGPAGSGKSTVARLSARALGWRFVDTGATYRAVTLAVLRQGVALDDSRAIVSAVRKAEVSLVTDPEAPAVLLAGEDVSVEVRGDAVTAAVSAVSAVPEVRALLVRLQREAIGTAGAVVEGRDIATVVAPKAAVKIYLDARPDVRARRRAGEGRVTERGSPVALADVVQVKADLARRDALDAETNRLAATDGAVHLDTSELTLDEVVAAVVDLARTAGLVA